MINQNIGLTHDFELVGTTPFCTIVKLTCYVFLFCKQFLFSISHNQDTISPFSIYKVRYDDIVCVKVMSQTVMSKTLFQLIIYQYLEK